MAALVTREKVFKIIFLFISSFKSYVNSEHKVATLLKKTFFKKTQRFFAYFSVCMYSCMFFCTPRAVPEMYTISESLSLKKNHNLWHCSALQDNCFLCASSSVRHILIMIGLALTVSDRLDDTLYHDSLINLALCVIFI